MFRSFYITQKRTEVLSEASHIIYVFSYSYFFYLTENSQNLKISL